MNPKIKKVMSDFSKVQNSLSSFGACDTEPDGHFHYVIRAAVTRQEYPIKNLETWELYSGMKGSRAAMNRIDKAARRAYRVVLKEAVSADLKELQQICWRTDFNL